MHFSTPLVLFAAIVTGVFPTVSAVPHTPSAGGHNSLNGQSDTGKHTVLHSPAPTTTSKLHYKKSYLDNQSIAADHNPEFDRQRLQHRAHRHPNDSLGEATAAKAAVLGKRTLFGPFFKAGAGGSPVNHGSAYSTGIGATKPDDPKGSGSGSGYVNTRPIRPPPKPKRAPSV
ncbi:hypothetical protein BC835DRAFT_1309474 [Cytidiella melzeri]|nr:hypothetical protein BC835DRAFT_1309474 [Cytidiella melzeri]